MDSTTVPHMQDEPFEIRRSPRRRRTISVFREQGRVVAVIPAAMTRTAERMQVPGVVRSFLEKEARRRPPTAEAPLTARATALVRRYLPPELVASLPVFGVRWSQTQRQRWGSCTPATGEIRLSSRLRALPDWVVDYVLMHELVHLVEGHHNARFWALVSAYPATEKARGFLEGYSAALAGEPISDDD